MLLRVSSLLAVLLTTAPAAAVTLPHPDLPIVEACAADMDTGVAQVAARISGLGWIESELGPELQALGNDLSKLRAFEWSVYNGNSSADGWNTALAELELETGGAGRFDGTDPTSRVFRDPDGAGFAILTPDEGLWSCEILLTTPPPTAMEFMSGTYENGDGTRAEGVAYLSVDIRPSFLGEIAGLIPSLHRPKTYYAEYTLADPAAIELQFGSKTSLTFAAEINVIDAF